MVSMLGSHSRLGPKLQLAIALRSADMVWFWQGFCPQGHICRKKGKQLAWHQDRNIVLSAVVNHLISSTYHQMHWEEARCMADDNQWIREVDYDEEGTEQDAEAAGGGGRSQPETEEGTEGGEASPHDEVAERAEPKSKGKGKSKGKNKAQPRIDENRVVLRSPRRRERSRSPRRVSMRASELQTILDSLERAAQASEYSANLSRTAAKAFDDQAATLRASQRLLQEALVHSTR